MSIQTEITRIQSDRNTIRDKLVNFGLAKSTDNLDALATAIDGITNQGDVSAEVQEGATYTIPKGYHTGSGTVSGVKGGGNYSLQSKTVTPTKSSQQITPDAGKYGLSDVTVNPIPEAYQNTSVVNATAPDVLAGKIIVDSKGTTITGTMTNNGAVSKTLDTGTTSYTIPKGYHSGSGTVKITTETQTVEPSTIARTVTPSTGKVLSSVTVKPIPDSILMASDLMVDTLTETRAVTDYGGTTKDQNGTTVVPLTTGTASERNDSISYRSNQSTLTHEPQTWQTTSADLLTGKFAYCWYEQTDGSYKLCRVTGSMPNNGAISGTIDTSTTSYTIPKGYHNGSGTVKVVTETKSATPTTGTQTVSASSGKVLKSVTVNPIPDLYMNGYNMVFDLEGTGHNPSAYAPKFTTTSDKVLSGTYAIILIDGEDATRVKGSMPNNGAVNGTINGLTTTSYTIPAGYHNGSGKVSLTSDIENALKAI